MDVFSLLNDSEHTHTPKLKFYLVGPGITQMIDANRQGAIERVLRTRKLPVTFQFGSRKVTLIVDVRDYVEVFDRMGGMLTLFKTDGRADLLSGLADIQSVLALHQRNLDKPETVSEQDAQKSSSDS